MIAGMRGLRRTLAIAGVVAGLAGVQATSAIAASEWIRDMSSGLVVDVRWGSTAEGAPLHLWPDNGSQAQRFDRIWIWESTEQRWHFQLRAGHSGLCLAPPSPYEQYWYSNGTIPLAQHACDSSAIWQRWVDRSFVTSSGVRQHVLENQLPYYGSFDPSGNWAFYSRPCLDVQNGPEPNQPGMTVGLFRCHGDGWALKNQHFQVQWSRF